MFDMLDESAYFERPIALRNPVVFYEGHIPAFAVNTLVKKALGKPGIDEHLEIIFARGIDPDSEAAAVARGNPAWPSREVVRQYTDAADQLVLEAIDTADLDRAGHPLLDPIARNRSCLTRAAPASRPTAGTALDRPALRMPLGDTPLRLEVDGPSTVRTRWPPPT